MVDDVADQYRRAFRMLYEEMERFDADQWLQGISAWQVPVNVAMHIVDCLDFYFCAESGEGYRWGHRFGGGWWELNADRRPDRDAVLAYAREIEARVLAELATLNDADLARPVNRRSGATLLGHYIYALRHTMHHHGELSALAVYHGHAGGSWA
jgi:hypothetical protein